MNTSTIRSGCCPRTPGASLTLLVASVAVGLVAPVPGARAAAAAAASAPASPRNFQQVFAEATAAREAGRLEDAARLLREAYAIAPTPALLNNLGRVLETLGRYDEASAAYTRVVDDPDADAQLRSLDAARLAKLEGRLGAAWVVAHTEPADATLLVDGRPPGAAQGQAFRLDGGDHVFEVASPRGDRVRLIIRRFPLNRRTVVRLRVTPASDEPAPARLVLDGPALAPDGLAVDGYQIQSPLDRLAVVLVRGGRHRARVERADGRVATGRFTVGVGETLSLGGFAPRSTLGAGAHPPAREASVSPWPWIVAGVGAAGVATGVGLYLTAEGDLNTITSARRNEMGHVIGLTYAEARTLEGAAADKRTAALAATVAGGALLAGGVIWGIVDAAAGPPETDQAVRVSLSPRGVAVAGRF